MRLSTRLRTTGDLGWLKPLFVVLALALVFVIVAPLPVVLLAIAVVLVISWLKRRR